MRGTSPVVATVLLTIISVAVSAIFAYWYLSLQRKVQTEVEKSAEEEISRFSYKIDIDNVICNSSSNTVKIFVRNVGDKSIPSGDGYVFVYDENFTILGSVPFDFPGLDPNRVYIVEINFTLVPGKVYYFKVSVPKISEGPIGSCEAQ